MPTVAAVTPPPLPAPFLWLRRDDRLVQEHAIAGGVAAVVSSRHPFKDTDNEDGAALIPVDDDRAVLVVADGVGGHVGGADASALALQSVVESVVTATSSGPIDSDTIRAGILRGIELANQRVGSMGIGAATTLAVVEIDGDTVRPYHVGDSEILVVGQRGKVRLQTISHSPVAYAQEAGVLNAHEAIHHEDRHLVSNVVGMSEMRIEVGPLVTLRPRDTVLVSTDGLVDNMYPAEVIEQVRCGPLTRVAIGVMETCRGRMLRPEPGVPSKPDDLTYIVYRPQAAKAAERRSGPAA